MVNKDKIAQTPGDVVEARDAPSVAKGIVDDHDDIQNAQTELREQPIDKRKSLLRIGPGLITGVADDDPSGIGTYSVAGAQFGYQLLWLAPVCLPLMIAVQEMCGRLALVTSKGLSANIKEYYPKWLLYSVLILLVGANTINVYADINIMAASMKMLFGARFRQYRYQHSCGPHVHSRRTFNLVALPGKGCMIKSEDGLPLVGHYFCS
ncbi:MAG: divalent metal cation transporter [Desulfobacteraceae bacterium]|jgi:hypothetical protein